MMCRIVIALIVMLISFSGAQAINFVDSQVVCHIVPGADVVEVAELVSATVLDGMDSTNTYLFGYSYNESVDSVVTMLERLPDVTYAQPNYVVNIFDPYQVSQPFVDITSSEYEYGVSPLDYYEQYVDDNLMLDSAQYISTGAGLTVAVIDGGLDNSHPMFSGQLASNSIDIINGTNQPWITGGIIGDHGTFVSGMISRALPEAKIMVIRAFAQSGRGTSFNIARAIRYAVNNGADAINMSFGSDNYDHAIAEEINNANARGIVMVAAAGNAGMDVNRFPGSHQYVINVAAVDSNDVKADFSNYGSAVSICAPGVNLYGPLSGGDSWGWWSGTSFAAPYVAALAAVIKLHNPQYSPSDIINHIQGQSTSIEEQNGDYVGMLGAGRVDYLASAFVVGDANYNGSVNIGDVVFMVNFVFKAGSGPIPPEAADANCDATINVGDPVTLINYIFGKISDIGCQ